MLDNGEIVPQTFAVLPETDVLSIRHTRSINSVEVDAGHVP